MTPWKIATIACAATAGFLILATAARPATQGGLGSTSSGSVGIRVTLPQLVRVQGLSDLEINPYSGPSAMAASNLCVFSNAAGGYDITATSAEGGFSLSGVAVPTESITYSVEWAAAANAGFGTALAYNTAVAALATGGAHQTCSNVGGANATLIVRVKDSDLGTASAQTYTGTLNLTIAPH